MGITQRTVFDKERLKVMIRRAWCECEHYKYGAVLGLLKGARIITGPLKKKIDRLLNKDLEESGLLPYMEDIELQKIMSEIFGPDFYKDLKKEE